MNEPHLHAPPKIVLSLSSHKWFTQSTFVDLVNTSQHQLSDSVNKIAEEFKAFRAKLGLTQQELADRLLLTRNYIAKIETGSKKPSVRVMRQMGDLLAKVDSVNSSPLEHVEKVETSVESYSGNPLARRSHGSVVAANPNVALQASREPSADDVLDYVKECLEVAKYIPGGIGHVFIEITDTGLLEQLRERRKKMKKLKDL